MSAIIKRFQVSVTTCFVLEFGYEGTSGYLRFFTNAQQVEFSGGPLELATPYQDDELLGLQVVQVNDYMYVVHANHPVYRLTRNSDTDWDFEEVDWNEPAFLDENLEATTITPSGTTGTITLTASPDLFDALHVGAYFRIGHFRDGATLSHDIDANESSSTIPVFGPYVLRSYGTWSATLAFEQSTDAGATWQTVHESVSVSDSNLEIRGTAELESLMRVTVSGFASATAGRATIETEDAVIYGFVKITAVGSGGSATATVKESLYATTATELWAEGAWSDYRGFPRAITLHEQRLVLGGTTHQPSVVWGSVIDDFENFARGTDDDDSFTFQLAGLELNAIQWMASLKALLIGTTGSEWRVIGDELGAVISPTKVSAKQFSFEGSEYVQAENTGKSVMFVGRKGKILWEVSPDGDSFALGELTLLAEHLFDDGTLAQLAWQRDARIMWCVTTDGRALGLTYNRDQAVLGWHRHVTQGSFRSVATIYGDTDAEDEVWFIVEREVGSTAMFYVERLNPVSWEEREDYFGVDSGLSYSGTPTGSFAGLDHLVGETVDALVDGVVYAGLVVSAEGIVTLPSGVTGGTVHVGLPYTSILTPFRLDADTQLGVHLGKSKRIDNLHVRLYRSAGVTYDFGSTVLSLKAKDGQVSTGLFGESEADDFQLQNMTKNEFDPRLTIRGSSPLPLTVMALRVGYGVASS